MSARFKGSPAPAQTQKTVGRGVARGAVGGLAISNITGGSGRKGMAAGAEVGVLGSGAQNNRRRSAAQQSAAQSQHS